MNSSYVLAITGASGAIYGVRLLDVLLNACCDVQLAISPAGSSLPELIRKPVLNRARAVCNCELERPRLVWAIKELTFVLIRLMNYTL